MKRFILSQLLVLALAASLIAQGGLAVYARRIVSVAAGGACSVTFEQGNALNENPTSTTIATSATFNIAAGDFLVAVLGSGSNSNHTMSGGATVGAFTELCDGWDGTNNYRTAVYYKENSPADAAATITGTFVSTGQFRMIGVQHWSGIAASAIDITELNTICGDNRVATSTGRTTGNVTTTNANDLLIVLGTDWAGTAHTAATGWTLVMDAVTPFGYVKTVSSTGLYPSGNAGTVSPGDEYFSAFVAAKCL